MRRPEWDESNARAVAAYPSVAMGRDAWTAFFGTPEGEQAMGRMIRDLYSTELRQREREDGVKAKQGRRARPAAVGLNQVMKVVMPPAFTHDPFPVAFKDLLGPRPFQRFARRVHISRRQLQRYADGELPPDRFVLEQVAGAFRISPSYFPEWRVLYLQDELARRVAEDPTVGIELVKRLRNAPDGPRRAVG